MNEMDVDPVDIGDEVWMGIDLRFRTSPVVVLQPIVGKLPDRVEMDTLRRVVLALRPLGGCNLTLQIAELSGACPKSHSNSEALICDCMAMKRGSESGRPSNPINE